MNRNIMFALAGGFAAGMLAGYFFFGGESHQATAPVVAAPTAPIMPAPSLGGGMPGAGPAAMPAGPVLPSAEVQARIARIQAAVMADPKNHDAWVALGNEFFDTHQHQKAVDAYAKALALKPDEPDVLTDQGVMYRDLGQFDKALANFQKANKVQPAHLPSLINAGIVYANDLHKPADAAKTWNKVIATAPTSKEAAQARQLLSQLGK